MSTPDLIDRDLERAELIALSERPGYTMAVLYGRRRIGKTYLLRHLWPADRVFYFTATEGTSEINRRAFIDAIGRRTNESLRERDYASWRRVFERLLTLGAPAPTVVVLDEYQYLKGDSDSGVDSELAAAWDEAVARRPKRRPFLLVLAGSIVRVMERLDAPDNPLYGRLDWKARLEAFDYLDAGAMAPFSDLRDRTRAYGIFGGTPRYLATIDPSQSLATNVAREVLAPSGSVRLQIETVIAQEHGLRDIRDYQSILVAVGRGHTERNAIAQEIGLPLTQAFRAKLDTLVDLRILVAEANFDAPSSAPRRYRLADPALRFYYGILAGMLGDLDGNPPMEIWRQHVAPRLDVHMGLVFEALAVDAYRRLRAGAELPLIREWRRWEGRDRDKQPTEVDIVARASDGRMLTGSVKWNVRPIGPAVHAAHLSALRRLASSGYRWPAEALEDQAIFLYIAACGVTPNFPRTGPGPRVIVWSLADLYQS